MLSRPSGSGAQKRTVSEAMQGQGGKEAAGSYPEYGVAAVVRLAKGSDAAKRRRKQRQRQQEDRDSDSDSSALEGSTVDRWEILDRVGSGSFADCFLGRDVSTQQYVCLKLEDETVARNLKLHDEWQYLSALKDGPRRTPQPLGLVRWRNRYHVLSQELLGPSLEDLFQKCDKKFSAATVAFIAPQVLDCIEHVHRAGILHRDIKPHNFLLGRGPEATRIFLIDFGLSVRYIDSSGRHIPFREDRPLIGTSRYVSLAVHRGHEQGRRDDLESISHMFYYFVWGQLPWQGLPRQPDKAQRHRAIFMAKKNTSLSTLCDKHPPALKEYLVYARALKFAEEPDYARMRALLEAWRDKEPGGNDLLNLDWRKNRIYTEGMDVDAAAAAAAGPRGTSESDG